MTELEVKLVKVDNWGIFFLQRLKHFFNRTDYCDLTLQFQDNAQLKVHRLVLSACTEYFELLERTCEMYEDCLVMPDDLQADVVVPIVNFMYTGQLEFRMDLLERLYQTSQIMNMPVLTKLLDAHRNQPAKPAFNYNSTKRSYSKSKEPILRPKQSPAIASSSKRPYSKAFGNPTSLIKESKKSLVIQKPETANINTNNGVPTPYQSPNLNQPSPAPSRKISLREPRPTRYELPEELDTDNIFDNSFTNISYASQPLMVHPETTKQYQRKKGGVFGESSGSLRIDEATSTLDIVECKRVPKKESIFDEHDNSEMNDDLEMFNIREQSDSNITNQLFDQIIDQPAGPKVTIETRDAVQANNIDHAKIISEVLKKYPHLVKSNKNIKLKILNTPATPTTNKAKSRKQRNSPTPYHPEKEIKMKTESDCTFETDVLDSKEAARLIAMGAENVKGPWICLICGTPGRALHFTSYYKFRRHLVEVHNEKPVSNMCEYCGLKSLKRNYLLHHLLTKHGKEPPPQYHFPKCNVCSYIALTEGLLVKHKLTHSENRSFRCNVCFACYNTSNQLLAHIQSTGHKYCADRKTNLQCVYCLKVFLREGNLYAHLKTYHKQAAKSDGIIDNSDEESQKEDETTAPIKHEPQNYETEYEDVETQYQIRPDGNIELVTKQVPKQRHVPSSTPIKQKILNAALQPPAVKSAQKPKPPIKSIAPIQSESSNEEIVMIDNDEYIMRNNQLIPRKKGGNTYVLPEMMVPEQNETLTPSTSLDFSNIQDPMVEENLIEQKMMIKKTTNLNQPIQIVVSNEEEYKALMNSNHSIIFDNGDSNKTLTVLSTPHNTAINTLDLEDAQTNNMMIIQDNYPISVSEALPGDNSNIVVVYSHAVDEQNKPFQLITSQDIGAQFVESSAVITQNFATPTTVASVMEDAQVIDSQMTESWHTNTQNIQRASHLQEIHEMEIIERAEIIPLEQSDMSTVEETELTPVHDTGLTSGTDTELTPTEHAEIHSNAGLPSVELGEENINNELSEVTLAKEVSQATTDTAPENNMEEAFNQPNEHQSTSDNVPEDHENEKIETAEVENNLLLSVDTDIPTESANDKPSDIIESDIECSPNKPLPEISSNIGIEENTVVEQLIPEQPAVNEQSLNEDESEEQGSIVEEHVSEEDTDAVSQAPESAENESADVNDEEDIIMTDQDNTITTTPSLNETKINPEETKEQIQNLTLEWSEDEYDTEAQEQVDENAEKDSQNISEGEPQEMEESIENIQQEMEKQVSEASGDTEDSVNENVPGLIATKLPVEPPQAKISSLLNDWDENDSQEGNDSTNGTEDESIPSQATAVAQELNRADNTAVLEKIETRKDDKIKSLVSDWDDDEDDNKN